MFIELDENNKIIASSNFKFNENAIETNKEVVRNYKGELVFKEELDVSEELEYKKQKKIQKLKTKNEDYFYSIYPLYKQNNISIYGTQDEKLKFKIFHDEQITKYDNLIQKIINCNNIEELKLISTQFHE